MKIRLIVDSGSNFTAEEVEKLNLGWVPLNIIYPDGRIIADTPELGTELYNDIATGKLKTSQPSPDTIARVFEETLHRYDYGIYLPLSSALSGTYMAANLVLSEMKTDRIKVIDSRQITIGIDVLVMRMLEEMKKGLSFDRVHQLFDHIRSRQRFYFLLETLEHLLRGGRIGRARYAVGTMLKVVPLLVIDDEGYINASKKARGVKKVIKMIREYVSADTISPSSHMHVVLGRPKHKDILPFAREMEDIYGAKIKLVRPLTAIHVGIWGVGVSYIAD